MSPLTSLAGALRRLHPLSWPERSQLGSRRNALVAATALAEVCREHRDVAEFLEVHAPWCPSPVRSPLPAASAGGL